MTAAHVTMAHPPHRQCGCAECVPSFEPALAEIGDLMAGVATDATARSEKIATAIAAQAINEQQHRAQMREINACIAWMRGNAK